MRKVDHVGTVVRVDGGKATIEVRAAEQCFTFAYRCACCDPKAPETKKIRVPRGELKAGDVVCVSIPAYRSYLSTLVVLGLPAALFAAGATVGWLLEERAGAHDLGVIMGGLCGFAVAVVVAVLVNRKLYDSAKFDVRAVAGGGQDA